MIGLVSAIIDPSKGIGGQRVSKTAGVQQNIIDSVKIDVGKADIVAPVRAKVRKIGIVSFGKQ